MPTTREIQHDLDTAQDDLERDVAELKQVIEDKIESVEAPITFLRQHGLELAVGVMFALGLLVGRLTGKDRR